MSALKSILPRLTQIKAQAAAATPGPWESIPQDAHQSRRSVRSYAADAIVCDIRPWGEPADEADAQFVAASRADVPALVEALEQAVGLLNEIDSDLCAKWDAENSAKLVRHRIREALGQEPAR